VHEKPEFRFGFEVEAAGVRPVARPLWRFSYSAGLAPGDELGFNRSMFMCAPVLTIILNSLRRPGTAQRAFRGALVALGLAVLAACSPATHPIGTHDPGERVNRQIHGFNKALDSNVVSPTANAYMKIPAPITTGVSNVSANLGLPGVVLNDLFQGELEDAFVNTLRFTLNTTIGLAGLIDVASVNGVAERSTDFGETLHRWGFGEGAYNELPFFGPSTTRDTVGLVVDFAIDPKNYIFPAMDRWVGWTAYILDKLNDRGTYADLVDSVLYESEDSYAQGRLLYLDSRRRELYGSLNEDFLEDPYAE